LGKAYTYLRNARISVPLVGDLRWTALEKAQKGCWTSSGSLA